MTTTSSSGFLLHICLLILFITVNSIPTFFDDVLTKKGARAPPPADPLVRYSTLPLDGSLKITPNISNPFHGARLEVRTNSIRLIPIPQLDPRVYTDFIIPDSCFIDSVEMTSRAILLGLATKANDSFVREIQVIGCEELSSPSEDKPFCTKMIQIGSFMLGDFVLADPVPPTLRNVPQKYMSISRDSNWVMILPNSTCVDYLLLDTESAPERPRSSQPITTKTPASLILVLPFTYPYVTSQARIWPDWTASVYVMEWDPAAQQWTFREAKSGTRFIDNKGSQPDFILLKANLIMAENNSFVSCLDLYGEKEVVNALWMYGIHDADSLVTLNAESCDNHVFQAVPCGSISGLLQVYSPHSIEAASNDRQCILYSEPLPPTQPNSVLVSVATQQLNVVYNSSQINTTSAKPVRILPNILQPTDIASTSAYGTFAAQMDAMYFFEDGIAYKALMATGPGMECAAIDTRCYTPSSCQIGFYKPGLVDLSPCLPCPYGTHQFSQGQVKCLPCTVDQYCPSGTAYPRSYAVVTQTSQSDIPFPVRATTASIQRRMIYSVFNPLPSPATTSKQQFFTLLGTAIAGLSILIIAGFVHRSTTTFQLRPILLKVDLFKEPGLHNHERKIIDEGSMAGVFFTLLWVLSVIMCLWFLAAFYNDYFPFLIVPTAGLPAATLNDSLGLNNDHSVKFETNEGVRSPEKPAIDDMRTHLNYTMRVRLVDIRPIDGRPLTEVCQLLSVYSFAVSGCFNSTGGPCGQAETAVVYADLDGQNDCIIAVSVQSPHTLAKAQVGKFKLDHAISIPMGTGDAALSPRLSVPITTSYIVRQTSIHPPDTMVTQGFVSLTTSALHAASASSIQTWLQGPYQLFQVNITVAETPFWVVQKSTRAASQTDLLVVLLLTAVTLNSGFRASVKFLLKVREKYREMYDKYKTRKALSRAMVPASNWHEEDSLLYPESSVDSAIQ